MSDVPPHPFEELTQIREDFICVVCFEPMLPCYSFGCHQICGFCADSLPNKRKCPTCNKIWKDPPMRNALITNMIEEAVAAQVFRCGLCQAILTGRVERDAHPQECAAVLYQQQQQLQLQQLQHQLQELQERQDQFLQSQRLLLGRVGLALQQLRQGRQGRQHQSPEGTVGERRQRVGQQAAPPPPLSAARRDGDGGAGPCTIA